MAQEYGRYFGMKVCVFRGGCLTGPSHSGVELHGFLSYLVKVAVSGGTYKVFGYKAKQVRDNIHSHDVVQAMEEYAANPRPGEVYNMGGGRENSISMLEAIAKIAEMSGKKLNWKYVDENRKGDHICYISDLDKFKSHYPNWKITIGLDEIFRQSLRTTPSVFPLPSQRIVTWKIQVMAPFKAKLQNANPCPAPLRWIPSWAIELWIASVLMAFFLIRVLGSGTGQRIFHFLGLGHTGS